MALLPLLVPPDLKLARFVVALFVLLMTFKMWDLHVGATKGSRPNFPEFLGFLANLFFLVWRKRGIEPQPTMPKNLLDLVRGIFTSVAAAGALYLLGEIDWSAYPFLLEHALIAVTLFAFGAAQFTIFVALVRLLGGYIVDANDMPIAARTPADFWRRYNRLVGQFLYEDFFKPMQGRRHPVRATLGVFAISGLIHEYLFWMAVSRSAGLQLLFFMLQGCAVALTLRIKPLGWQAIPWGLGTFTFSILTSVFFFASVHHALSIYQNGLPGWLSAW